MRRNRIILSLGISICLCASAVAGVALPDGVAALIDDLDASSYELRTVASERLKIADEVTLKDLEEVLEDDSLTPEQRRRLLRVAEDRFRGSPRAAMGVRFGGVLRTSRIVIGDTFEAFPSSRVLEPGDMIIEANGIPLGGDRSWPTLRALIIARDPGDSLPVVIRRGAERLPLEVQLGRYEDLQGSTISETDYMYAWSVRSASFRRIGSVPFDPEIDASVWDRDAATMEKERSRSLIRNGVSAPRMIAGGEPRGGVRVERDAAERMRSIQRGRALAERRAMIGGPVNVLSPRGPVVPVEQELSTLETERANLERVIGKLEGEVRDEPSDQTRQMRVDELAAKQKELRILLKEQAAVLAEIAERDEAASEASASP